MTAFGHAIGFQAVVTGMFAVPSLIMHLEFFTRSIDYPWHELSCYQERPTLHCTITIHLIVDAHSQDDKYR